MAGSRANATLYRIADRFGNPAAPGFVVVRAVYGAVTVDSAAPILGDAAGSSADLWANAFFFRGEFRF